MSGLEQFFAEHFSEFIWLAVLLFAMLPITEARLAIPFGLSVALWGNNSISPWLLFLCAYVGSTIPTFIIIPLLKPVFKWLKKSKFFNKIITYFETKFNKSANNIENKQFKKMLTLTLFVAIPLPLTGVWMGSGIAAFTNLKWWQGVLCICIGNLIACSLLMLISLVFGDSIWVLLIIFISIIAIYLLTLLVLHFVKKYKAKKAVEPNLEINNEKK